MKFLAVILIVVAVAIRIFVYFRNIYRLKRTDSLIENIQSKNIKPEKLTAQYRFIYARKQTKEDDTLSSIEKKLFPHLGEKIQKEKYTLYSVKKINDFLLIIISASINDFIPIGSELNPKNHDYKKSEFYNYILRVKDKEAILFSDSYSDLRMKLDKEEVSKFLMQYI